MTFSTLSGCVTDCVRSAARCLSTKITAPVSVDVSQISCNVPNPEMVAQENGSYPYNQDRECDGDELFAVKSKGKGGFKGTCFKCEVSGHKAD